MPVPEREETARRKWEAPTAGLAYDLQGPDAQAVTMAAAPKLGSDELAFEMAEVYELALLRDEPFQFFDSPGGSAALTASVARMNGYEYAQAGFPNRPRKTEGGELTRQTAFRGSSRGVDVGPYLSQFLLIGNDIGGIHSHTDGQIAYGALTIDQRVPVADPGVDFLTNWRDWLDVQNGFDVRGPGDPGQPFSAGTRRFMHTPRDLATYVHFDALYEAYLNACLILLAMNAPFDPGFATLSGARESYPSGAEMAGRPSNVGGFALYGGPHILTMVTEVATRALKAARYQKFNNHLRLRPEALAARIHKAPELDAAFPQLCGDMVGLRGSISDTVDAIETLNAESTALLPMAFAEGSPMHPSYAAGHATVAGACITVLKAFFDTGAVLIKDEDRAVFRHAQAGDVGVAYESRVNGTELVDVEPEWPLTLEGELNKLAANISIGRNMAGVHYFSDYYDSLRMGEEIAIGILQEQALCYSTDPFVMSLTTFDGETLRIGAR
ncbi:vanadium-dependent haloperoxidase [Sulfitobacter sp. SK012]|uniref:vanadium-dependent haloperoxidase n=1 Tax=Sulfitobacter sp. SK012 TaxID=1389005 RepID=UPI001C2001E8|nr:vanadium-dependent haloperoxidase [Sulfitobacter sp. SK012]